MRIDPSLRKNHDTLRRGGVPGERIERVDDAGTPPGRVADSTRFIEHWPAHSYAARPGRAPVRLGGEAVAFMHRLTPLQNR